MGTAFDHDSELEFLSGLLHQAATYAQTRIDALPTDISVSEEVHAIDAIAAPAAALAKRMVGLPVIGGLGHRAKARAQAWLDGKYWTDFVQAA